MRTSIYDLFQKASKILRCDVFLLKQSESQMNLGGWTEKEKNFEIELSRKMKNGNSGYSVIKYNDIRKKNRKLARNANRSYLHSLV